MFGRDKKPQIDYKRQRRNANRRGIFRGVGEKLKSLTKYFLALVVVLIGVGIIFVINRDEAFAINNVKVMGTYRIDKKGVESLLAGYKGKNILKVSRFELEDKIRATYGEVKNIYISKELSGNLNVEIVESSPVAVLVNALGIFLLNNRGDRVGEIEYPAFALSDEDKKIVSNQIALDDPKVKEKFLQMQEGLEEPKTWEESNNEDKRKAIEALANDIPGKINSYFAEAKNKVKSSPFVDLVIIGDSSIDAKTSSFLNQNSIEFILKITESVVKIPLTVVSIDYWIGDTFSVLTDQGKTLLFYPRRSADDQLRDLNILIVNGIYNNQRQIDLRGEKISVQ